MKNERGLGRRSATNEGGLVHRSGPPWRTAKPALASRVAQRPDLSEGGFTLIEVMISTLVLTIGLVGIAGMLAVTTQAHIGARESARSVRLAQEKLDELLLMPFTSAAVAVGGSLDANVANYFEAADDGITVRWLVANGPMLNDDTRYITVRVVNMRGQQYRNTEVSSLIRD